MRKKKPNLIADMTFDFALKTINLYQHLTNEKREFILSKQLLRSGTSIGANVREAVVSQSRKEFIAKLNIALKEVHETEYWLELLQHTSYVSDCESMLKDIDSIIRIITSIIKTSHENKQS